MRFRLRTLLILVAAVSVPFAWLAWLKQNANFHRRECAKLVGSVATTTGRSAEAIQMEMAVLAQCPPVVTRWVRAVDADGTQWTIFRNGGHTWLGKGKVNVHEFATAVYHSILAQRYTSAQFRPWILVSEPAVKPQAVYVPLSDDSAWHGIARPPMVEVKAE